MVGYLPLPPSDTPRRALVPVSPAEPTADPDEADHERIGTSSWGPPGPEPVWRPLKPPLIVVDPSFVLDRWRPNDGAALRRFDLDPETARFFGYTVEQAKAMPDSHYDGDMRARENLRAWRAGKQLNLAIRRRADGEAVGWVELQPVGNHAEVSYNVTADLRGQGIAPRALNAFLTWAAEHIDLRRAHLASHVDNLASRRVAEKCGFVLVGREGDEYQFQRDLDA
jgi:RimJ/RimL family protein N-acetyltransferase